MADIAKIALPNGNTYDIKDGLVRTMISDVESSTTATRAYSVGEYLSIGNTLYKVTQAISSGGTITPGTNVTATTVGTELSSLVSGEGVSF